MHRQRGTWLDNCSVDQCQRHDDKDNVGSAVAPYCSLDCSNYCGNTTTDSVRVDRQSQRLLGSAMKFEMFLEMSCAKQLTD